MRPRIILLWAIQEYELHFVSTVLRVTMDLVIVLFIDMLKRGGGSFDIAFIFHT